MVDLPDDMPQYDIMFHDVTHTDKDNKVRFSPEMAAEAAINQLGLVFDGNIIWRYDKGVYVPDGVRVVNRVLNAVCGDYYTIRNRNETIAKIQYKLAEVDEFNPNPYLFGVENGVINLETGEFRDYRPEDLITLKSPVKYDKNAICPNIDKFLWDITEDDQRVATIKDAFVSAMIGKPLRTIYIWIGRGRNGKGILGHLFEGFFGKDQIGTVDIEAWDRDKFASNVVFNTRVVYASETQGSTIKTNKLKSVSGGDITRIEEKYGKPFMYRPHCTVVMDTNDPPKFNDESPGWKERLRPVKFPYRFVANPTDDTQKRDDPNILNRILAPSELSGFLNILMKLAQESIANGCNMQRVSSEDIDHEMYGEASHTVSSFFDRFCGYDSNIKPDSINANQSFAATEFLYIFYERYCEILDVAPKNQRSFTKYIKSELGLSSGRVRNCINPVTGEIDGTARRGFYGINFNFVMFKKADPKLKLHPMQNLITEQEEIACTGCTI